MTKKIFCQKKIKTESEKIKVRVIKAPLVNSEDLRNVVFYRTRAVVL